MSNTCRECGRKLKKQKVEVRRATDRDEWYQSEGDFIVTNEKGECASLLFQDKVTPSVLRKAANELQKLLKK
jgi:hypothetical protein